MKPLQKIAIVTNASKPGAEALASELEQIAKESGVSTVVTSDFPCQTGLIEGSDACFVVGGDGTLLGMMNEAVRYKCSRGRNPTWETWIFSHLFSGGNGSLPSLAFCGAIPGEAKKYDCI